MIDWLRKEISDPAIEIDGRTLPIAIRRHARARRMTMRLAPDGSEVRVTLPPYGRTRDALVFAEARREWIADQLGAVPEAMPVEPGGFISWRGRDLAIAWDAAAPRKPSVRGDTLLLGGPRDGLDRRVQRWLEAEALRLMGEDLPHYCRRADLPVPQLRLSRARRRWGSCSGKGCIRMNWRLVQAPDHVRRSVVAHEVAHLVHFDHSPAFHALLAELFEDDIRPADRWLKEHGRALYAQFG